MREFPGHGSGRGNSGGVQGGPRVAGLELRFQERKAAGVFRTQCLRGECCPERELQRVHSRGLPQVWGELGPRLRSAVVPLKKS